MAVWGRGWRGRGSRPPGSGPVEAHVSTSLSSELALGSTWMRHMFCRKEKKLTTCSTQWWRCRQFPLWPPGLVVHASCAMLGSFRPKKNL